MTKDGSDALKTATIENCNIAFDEGRGNTLITKPKEGEKSKVFIITKVDRSKMIECLEKAIEN